MLNHNIMKFNILPAIAIVLFATACSGHGKQNDDNATENTPQAVADVDIRGQWYLENIVFSDSDYVRPAEEVPDSRQYILFEDSTYSIVTNCNNLTGAPYTIKGDSIWLGDGPMTEMACDNMATEDAIRRILPNITTVEIENDSVARLNGSVASEYILLRKANEKK